ncbi:hypothetical protein SEA_LAHQTEMISH_57 [Microbacterium phage Lahqtemish]|uniref:hypothetical protein n=1 Tax=Microbacterium phage Lahqtemish TaxID=2776867 RepID=UPI0018A39257|nr:hypothetical protein QDW25_gp57 [Microbacterium phage Lahqtemish]QOP66648.1 hypothetical protein SEA_LAHQTEMISH_57 [Microbacterium phage Lahqtemish]
MTPIEPTPAQIAAFKKAWHKADELVGRGHRTEAGLRAALNTDEFSELEYGFYVTANNVNDQGEANEGAVVMSKRSDGWRIETAVSYQNQGRDLIEDRVREWFDNVGLTRVKMVQFAEPTVELTEVYAIDSDGDRWEPVHATDLWHCVAPNCDFLEDRTSEDLERSYGPIEYHGLD